jgi:hypothetical protein
MGLTPYFTNGELEPMSRRWNGPGRKTPPTRFDVEQRRALRESRRRSLIEEAVRELGARATYERVALRTGLPLGYIEWAFPTEIGWVSATSLTKT